MSRSSLSLLLSLSLTVPAAAFAQVDVEITPPSVKFAVAPALVVIAPGVQVVPDHDDEVFFTNGWYWVRRDKHWFKSRSHGGGWAYVREKGVPPGLWRIPHGKYKRFHAAKYESRGGSKASYGNGKGHSSKGGSGHSDKGGSGGKSSRKGKH